MKKRAFYTAIAAILIYLFLLVLLKTFETASPGSNIHNFGDAFWYSIVTLTTVGYGDLFPVSLGGRVIGLIFVILSTGLLATVFFALINGLRHHFIPFLTITLIRNRPCSLFSEMNTASVALARDTLRQKPSSCIVFIGTRERTVSYDFPGHRTYIFPKSLAYMARLLAGGHGKHSVFLIKENSFENVAAVGEVVEAFKGRGTEAVKIYCRAPEVDGLEDVHYFDPLQCAARKYWQAHPLCPEEGTIVIIGSGLLAQALLDQAILVNCCTPFKMMVYHLFGDWSAYRRLHPSLGQVFSIDEVSSSRDMLLFHDDECLPGNDLLQRTDRIIFCDDDANENASAAINVSRYFSFTGRIYTAAPSHSMPGITFGTAEDIFTQELVVREGLDQRAQSLHEAYCRTANLSGGENSWKSLTPFLKNSNRAAADHMLTKLRLILPEESPTELNTESCDLAVSKWEQAVDKEKYRCNEHDRWCRFMSLYNWRYGPVLDSQHRFHPMLRPYEDLPESERRKDDDAWRELGSMKVKGKQ